MPKMMPTQGGTSHVPEGGAWARTAAMALRLP